MEATRLRGATALVCIAALMTSCAGLTRRGTRAERTPAPGSADVGSGLSLPTEVHSSPALPAEEVPAPSEEVTEHESAFSISVFDQNDSRAPHIPVEVTGPEPKVVVTDDRGIARITGPSGDYSFQVRVGCTDRLLVTFGSSARGRIVPGRVTEGSLRAEWQHRYAPMPNVFASTGPHWRVGQPVDVRYDVGDRCREGARSPDARFPTFRFRLSPTLRLGAEPRMQADGQGFATVQVVCAAPGEVELVLFDSRNPQDSLDLAANERSFGTRPSCVT